ncbi:MAG: hypothetical protein WA940_00265 [Sphingopyxis sp.]
MTYPAKIARTKPQVTPTSQRCGMNAPFPSADLAKAIGKTVLPPEVQRQLDVKDFIRGQNLDYAVRFHGADASNWAAPAPLGATLGFAKSATMLLTDAERVALMIHLLDAIEFDDPDLRQETEGCLNEISEKLA